MLLRGTHIYQLDHTHVFYFGLDENHDAEEFRMGMCGSGVGPFAVVALVRPCPCFAALSR